MKIKTLLCLLLSSPVALAASAPTVSPYAGQQDRGIKALSAEEIDAYLDGKGMGMARAAELNGYPGPRHVEDLSTELKLTPEQIRQTHVIFLSMQAQARTLGRTLIDEERNLDQRFASHKITSEELQRSLDAIGAMQGKLRAIHLKAHLEESGVLSSEQIARYAELRGYGDSAAHAHHGASHEH